MYSIFGLNPSAWAQIEAVGFIIIVICCVLIATSVYSLSIKLTEVMRDVIDIRNVEKKDNYSSSDI